MRQRPKTYELTLKGETQTQALAIQLASLIKTPCLIFLTGEIGAGKTTWVRAFFKALGIDEKIKSPSFPILETYELPCGHLVAHYDFYRLSSAYEFEGLGVDDVFDSAHIICIEWPEIVMPILPKPDISLHFEGMNETRQLSITLNNDCLSDELDK